MTWLLLTGAGLVAETVLIVVLGLAVTARDAPGNTLVARPDPDPAERVAGQPT